MPDPALLVTDGMVRTHDGVVQRACAASECCGPGDDCTTYRYFVKYVACGFGGDPDKRCAVNGPDIYVRCDEQCPNELFRILNDDRYRGWCFTTAGGKYWTEKCVDPPAGFERLPCDALLLEEILADNGEAVVECIDTDCNDPRCPGRAGYLIPTFCDSPCGNVDQNAVVCPTPEVDLSKCWYARDAAFPCGCIVIGPHSEVYTGPIGEKRIIDIREPWKEARNAAQACCECCHGCDAAPCQFTILANSQGNNLGRWDYCYKDATCGFGDCEDLVCCCGTEWHRTSAHYIRYQNEVTSPGLVRLEISEASVLETKRYAADELGTVTDLGCVSVSIFWQRRVWENDVLIDQELETVDGCSDPDYLEDRNGVNGCADGRIWYKPTDSWIRGAGSNDSAWFNGIASSFSIDTAAKKCAGSANPPPDETDHATFIQEGSYFGTQDCAYRSFGYQLHFRETSKATGNYNDTVWLGRATVWTTIIDPGACEGGCPQKTPKDINQSGGGSPFGTPAVTAGDFL